MPHTLNTINRRLADVAEKYPDLPALSSKPSGTKTWQTLTYRDVETRVKRFSLGLRALGIEHGDRVAILSDNRPEWAIADFGALAAGAVTVPVYPSLPPVQVAHILADSGARAIIAADAKQLQKVLEIREQCPNLTILVAMEPEAATGDVLSFEAVMQRGDEAAGSMAVSFETCRDSVTPDDLMSLIYTSGTTGNPKGAMLTHGNMIAELDGAIAAFPFAPPHELFLSFLPLSHVFERVTYSLALTMGAHTAYNDSLFKLMDNMGELHPTIMQCVPRVFEAIHERVLDTVAKSPPKKRKVFEWAVSVGDRAAQRRNAGRWARPSLLIQKAIAEKLVLRKVRERFGGKLKFFVSGGAALNPKTAHFFNAIGIPILEGWGLTETTAAATVNRYGRAKVGTVGTVGFGADVKRAEDGELLVRGPAVMRGYWNNPTATAEAIDKEGWFHTGDIGEIDSEGYVKITDRKKDILVLPNGKNVAPQPIETLLKTSPYISEIVLLSIGGSGIGALVIPNFERVKAWAKESGKSGAKNEELAADPAVRKLIKGEIDKLSTDLADFERIKRFALLAQPFTIEAGELTPSMKVKRKVVSEKYGAFLEKD